MNYKTLATAMYMSIAIGAYSAPIYSLSDMSSVFFIQSESETGSIESDCEKLLAFNLPKDKKKSSKKAEEVEEDGSDEDEEIDDTDEGDDDDDLGVVVAPDIP